MCEHAEGHHAVRAAGESTSVSEVGSLPGDHQTPVTIKKERLSPGRGTGGVFWGRPVRFHPRNIGKPWASTPEDDPCTSYA